jgi:signal transduction histidine kinase/DNA-binding NarL/FixJ family response regulator
MKQLLEQSKQQLLNPLGDARRKLLIILNIVYCILAPFFLISEKIATGNFVNDSLLYLVYGIAITFNLLSAIYNIIVFKKVNTKSTFLKTNRKKLDSFFGYASIVPILAMSLFNMSGFGNPYNDAILTDFALAQSLLIVVVIIIGRNAAIVWFVIVVIALFANVSEKGWDYEYHYLTPSETSEYKRALSENEPIALQRKTELEGANLSPPKITRYFNTWIVFIIVSFLVAFFFSGITIDILNIIPSVVRNIEQATEESKIMELEQKANEEKTNTFINLVHETKTPLTLINNYLGEYIRKHGESAEMTIIKTNVQRLTTDIVNFFDIERFNKGFGIYEHGQVINFSDLLSSKVAVFKSFASEKGIEIRQKIEDDCLVMANEGAIDRVINNLLENAIKFTPENGQIAVSLYKENGNLVFSVSDNGIGIPSHYHQKIFEPYFQLGRTKKSNEGMGMGLSIVKKIIDDIKGKIELHSDLNLGTKITVTLTSLVNAEMKPSITAIQSKGVNLPSLSPMVQDNLSGHTNSIMIVEDNVKMLNYLAETLKSKYNVYVAGHGKEALEKLNSITQLDLIISDVMMDTMDGFEFCKTLSMNEKYSHIPYIFLTAKTTQQDKIKGLGLGAIDYIEKPFLIDHLVSKIDSILANIKKQHSAIINKAYKSILSDQEIVNAHPINTLDNSLEKRAKKYGLTSREIEIVGLIIQGIPYKIIGQTLNISEKTVARHVSNIFSKVSVSNKIELINKLEDREF